MLIIPFEPVPGYPERILGPDAIDHPRSKDSRPHLTDILNDLADAIGAGKGNKYAPISEKDLEFYAAGGWLWERVFNLAHAESIADGSMWSPGEIECEGIVGTPDRLLIEDARGLVVQELKCRWQSANKFDSLEKNYWVELAQIQSYCYMLSTNHADIHVFYVCGDWKPPIPKARSAHLEFSDQELHDNWKMIRNHAVRKGWLAA